MVRPSDRLGVGWQALRAHAGRSLLTTLGIVAGVAAIVCTMSIGAGAEDEVAERLRSLGVTMSRLAPSERSLSATSSSAPAPMDIVHMTAATPATIPSVVSRLRPVWARSACHPTPRQSERRTMS